MIKSLANRDVTKLIITEREITLNTAIQGNSIQSLIKSVGEKVTLQALTGVLLMSSEYFTTSTTLSESQAIQTASLLMDGYPHETFQDFILCLKYAKIGKYGKIYRIDGQVVFLWFQQYLLEKYEHIEQIKHNKKYEHHEVASEVYGRMMEKLAVHLIPEKIQNEAGSVAAITAESHFQHFKSSIQQYDKKTLLMLKKTYKKENDKCINPQFDQYLEVIDEELTKTENLQ